MWWPAVRFVLRYYKTAGEVGVQGPKVPLLQGLTRVTSFWNEQWTIPHRLCMPHSMHWPCIRVEDVLPLPELLHFRKRRFQSHVLPSQGLPQIVLLWL